MKVNKSKFETVENLSVKLLKTCWFFYKIFQAKLLHIFNLIFIF